MRKALEDFALKIKRKEIKIAVVGLGYVGLPLALEFAEKGIRVIGIEIDKGRLNNIKDKRSYITDVSDALLKKSLSCGRFKAEGNFSALKEAEVIIICVPTPLKGRYHPDISYIVKAVKSIARHIRPGSLVILESTTYPGTTEEVILPLLESRGLEHGKDFFLSFSPERIDPGNKDYPVHKIAKVVGGITKEAADLAVMVYKQIIDKVVPVSSARVAEAVKLLENTFRLINIGLIDELAMMAHKMNIDIWEVVEAAATKPFGFMPFYPGPGVGGHCLDKNEVLCVKAENRLKIMQMPDFMCYLQSAKNKGIKVLSFDPLKRRSVFKEVIAASARPYSGQMIDISTEDGRRLKVTDLHPMFIYNNRRWGLKYAKDLKEGDCLPLCLKLPFSDRQRNPDARIDIIEELLQKGGHLTDKIRVKPVGFSWRDHAEAIKRILRQGHMNKLPDSYRDYLSNNALPLKYFYALKKAVKIDYSKVKLATGRGPSYSEMPAQVTLDTNFCRLIGYYLSEGCYTKDASARIRFSFNRDEKEYIYDVINILRSMGVRSSIYESKMWHTSCVKVSSDIFGFLLRDILGCGTNCYNMSVPEQIFTLNGEHKKAFVSGLFRGDACVEHFFGKWHYRKNQKEYFHNVNTANISFFTSSRRLFQQLIVILHDLGIVPTFKKRKYALSIFGYKQLELFRDIFDGKKKEILDKYLQLNKNRPLNKTFRKEDGFATVKIKSIASSQGDTVYSLETEKPHSFVTSYGIVVHNCIPKDPLYLYWKARRYGFKSRFIKLASDIITVMPEYVVERVINSLKDRGITQQEAEVLVLGVTYKKDVKDLRKSPALDIISNFQKKGVRVSYHDPLIPYLKIGQFDLKSLGLNSGNIGKFDCVVIATDHSSLDYRFILKNSRFIFDARNVYKGVHSAKVDRL